MKKSLRKFLKENYEEIEELGDLEILESEDIPEKKGVYIIVSTGTNFIYCKGDSRVIYIGKSDNINKRIRSHQKHLLTIKEMKEREKLEYWYYPKYHYMDRHGARVYYISAKGRKDAHNLERDIMEMFYDTHLSLPVGNAAFSFGKN
jgi:excinuclease UvrABC nuclease subunit